MELHRVSLRFKFMIIRLVAKGNALSLQLCQPLAVDLDARGNGGTRRKRWRYPADLTVI